MHTSSLYYFKIGEGEVPGGGRIRRRGRLTGRRMWRLEQASDVRRAVESERFSCRAQRAIRGTHSASRVPPFL